MVFPRDDSRFDQEPCRRRRICASSLTTSRIGISEPERRDFWEICEDRYQVRSTILTSQLPVARWHEQIGDPTLADGILDRLVHNAHRIEMRGDSMRKKRAARSRRANARRAYFVLRRGQGLPPLSPHP